MRAIQGRFFECLLTIHHFPSRISLKQSGEESKSNVCNVESEEKMNDFDRRVKTVTGDFLNATDLETVQVNVGHRCNQECTHCHVQAGPDRKEMMAWNTMELVIDLARKVRPKLVDITGGAPELNPERGESITPEGSI